MAVWEVRGNVVYLDGLVYDRYDTDEQARKALLRLETCPHNEDLDVDVDLERKEVVIVCDVCLKGTSFPLPENLEWL